MMSKIKKIMGVVLSLTLIFSMFTVAPASAEETALAISSVVNVDGGYTYKDGTSTTMGQNVTVTQLTDGNANTWLQWDAGKQETGVTLNINLAKISRVKKIEIYVGSANASHVCTYSKIPVTASGWGTAGDWGVKEEAKVLNTDGAIAKSITTSQVLGTGIELSNLGEPIEINVDYICDSFSMLVQADARKRMAVVEVKVYGEVISALENDVLRDSSGNAICTVETNKNTAVGYRVEKMMDNESDDTAASELTRWRAARPSEGGKETELIFRLDGVYDIAGFRASEYWQSKNQVDTTFKDVDLYVGNTTGAATEWIQIVDGLAFNNATVAGHSHNTILGTAHKGDSFKMVINGVDYSEEAEAYRGFNLLTDVRLYGEKTDDALSGTTMRYLEMTSSDDTESYDYIANSANKVTLTPTFSGTQPSTVAIAAYSEDGKLVGAAFGAANEEITMDISGTISYVKIFGWSSRDTLVPVSTTFSRYAVTQ